MIMASSSGGVEYVIALVVAMATCMVVTPLARTIAWKLGAVDWPSRRRVNKTAVPRMGGIAIFAGISLGCLAVAALMATQGIDLYRSAVANASLLCLSFVVAFMTGAVDDIKQIAPRTKMIGLCVGAILASASGVQIREIVQPFSNNTELLRLGWLAYPITVGYLIAYANIINLIDGLDGLASGIGALASLTMLVLAAQAHHCFAAILCAAIAGACLGFLRFNFHPATIFLGDSGSLLLGFALGVASLLNVARTASLTTIIVPLVVAGVPILDTASAIVRRVRVHVSIGHADKGHLHHRLLDEGLNQRQTVLAIYAWTLVLCLGAWFMSWVGMELRVTIFVLLVGLSLVVVRRLHLLEPVLLHYCNPATGEDEIVEKGSAEFESEKAAIATGHANDSFGRLA